MRNKYQQLERHLDAAKRTRRKLAVEDFGDMFVARFWRGRGDDVEVWRGEDADLVTAINKAGDAYAIDMLARHIFQE